MKNNKRDLLKGLAVGSAWATPVVSSVMLPVHASTTGCDGLIDVSIAFSGMGDVGWEIYVGVDGAEPVDYDSNSGVTAPLEVKRTLPEGTTEVWVIGNNPGQTTTTTISCCNAMLTVTDPEGNAEVCATAEYSEDSICSLTDLDGACF